MKHTDYLKLNGKIVRHNGSIFKIIAVSLFGKVLVDAECVIGPTKGTCVNLLTARTQLSKELRQCCNMGLVS